MRNQTGVSSVDCHISALRAELDNFAMMVAIAGSIGNALERGDACTAGFSAISAYLPSCDGIAAARQLLEAPKQADAQLTAALDTLQTRAAFARDLAGAALKTGEPYPDTAPVADSVRRLASLCFVVRGVLEIASRDKAPTNKDDTRRRVDAVLRRVSSGETPCLNSQGLVSVSGWAEQRKVERQLSELAIVVEHRGRHVNGRLINASATGLGLAGVDDVELNDNVTIHLPGGTCCAGRVAWVGPGRAGIVLKRALPPEILSTLAASAGGDQS